MHASKTIVKTKIHTVYLRSRYKFRIDLQVFKKLEPFKKRQSKKLCRKVNVLDPSEIYNVIITKIFFLQIRKFGMNIHKNKKQIIQHIYFEIRLTILIIAYKYGTINHQ